MTLYVCYLSYKCLFFFCFVFFFFKQKTAYEMRISDWSSDVCSSDLFVADPYVEPGFTREPVERRVDVLIVGGGFGGLLTGAELVRAGIGSFLLEIGRASCRERVCQYV